MGWGSWLGRLGKIGAGIAAPFTGGASLWAIPGISAIQGAKQGGWKGALLGGGVGLGEMYGAKGLGALLGKAGGGPGSYIQRMLGATGVTNGASGGPITSTSDVVRGNPAFMPFGGGGPNDQGPVEPGSDDERLRIPAGSGIGDKIKGILNRMGTSSPGSPSAFEGLGGALGRAAAGQAAGRETLGNFTQRRDAQAQRANEFSETARQRASEFGDSTNQRGQEFFDTSRQRAHEFEDEMALRQAQDNRADVADAMRQYQIGTYINQGGRPLNPSTTNPYAGTYGFGPVATTAGEREAAAALMSNTMGRLKSGGAYKRAGLFQPSAPFRATPFTPGAPFEPTPLSAYAEAGKGEKATNAGATIAAILAALFGNGGQ